MVFLWKWGDSKDGQSKGIKMNKEAEAIYRV